MGIRPSASPRCLLMGSWKGPSQGRACLGPICCRCAEGCAEGAPASPTLAGTGRSKGQHQHAAKTKHGTFPVKSSHGIYNSKNWKKAKFLHILNPVFSHTEYLLLDRDQPSVVMEASKASPSRGNPPALCKSVLSEFINQKAGS